ncbi:MAG: DNA repair protein RecO [Clostridia bacterium]|nr:DNA repair protein RecO [Clostridia bacterium]
MQNTTTDALILRVQERGATDRLLTLISADEGRFYAIVKGRSAKGREAAALEPYTLSNFEFYEKNGLKWVKNATVTEAFPGIRYDTEKLFLAAYFADVVFELFDEKAPAGEILPLCLNAMYMLSTTQNDDMRIKAAFEFRAAVLAGFLPDPAHCGSCGRVGPENAYLDVMNGALLCADCMQKKNALRPMPEVNEVGTRSILVPLTPSAIAALGYIATAEPRRVFAFRLLDEASVTALSHAAEAYLHHHLERGFQTLENYKRLVAIRHQMLKN